MSKPKKPAKPRKPAPKVKLNTHPPVPEAEQRPDPTPSSTPTPTPPASSISPMPGKSERPTEKAGPSSESRPSGSTARAASATAPSAATSTTRTTSRPEGAARLKGPTYHSLASKLAKKDNAPHVIVEARAGTGKTTTLIEGLKMLKGIGSQLTPSPQQRAVWDAICQSPPDSSVCFVAFNSSIAKELVCRVPQGCEAMTLHRLGNQAVLRAFPELRRFNLDNAKWVVPDLIAELTGRDIKDLRQNSPVLLKATEELVGLAKMNLVGLTADPDGNGGWLEDLQALASHHGVEMDGCFAEVMDLVPRVIERCKSPRGKINFDDMIWLPVVLNLPLPRYDLLLVDERQDLNKCQMELAIRAGHRIVAVGDRAQSIYGFAGADSEACRTFSAMLEGRSDRGLVTLPLTVTRRCGKAIVKEAQRYVPDFEAHESNPEGKVSRKRMPTKDRPTCKPEELYSTDCGDGDMVLCRTNAPLVSQCFAFLKRGQKANIQGRDVGQGLISTIKKLKAGSIPDLVGKLDHWRFIEEQKENNKRNPSEAKLQAIADRVECLNCFAEGAETVDQVIAKIEAVFTDDKESPGIKLSSIHKAKGLEARRVFILQPPEARMREDKMQRWELEQEDNLRYVAITRAIEELVHVS